MPAEPDCCRPAAGRPRQCPADPGRSRVSAVCPPVVTCWTGRKPAAVDRPRFVVDLEVEVHADPLEELVVQRDEADFDRHLQVLQAPQLFQQVDDLFVDLLGLADDQAQVGLEGRRSSPDRPPCPRWWAAWWR